MNAPILSQSRCGDCPIRHRAVCARCNADELEELDAIKYYRTYEAGQPIIWSGDVMNFVGSVVSETIAANAGIGFLMAQAGANFQMPLVFAGLMALAVEGIAMYGLFALVERRMTRWAFRSSRSAAA